MKLINVETFLLENFPSAASAPPYAILSHTWGADEAEVSFQEMTPGVQTSPTAQKSGFRKIEAICRLAREEYKLGYAWADTCCIDKSSSAELSEAINSMFICYQQAAVCIAFLADWKAEEQSFARCRWWKRGWTLQELIASKKIVFYDADWQERGDKLSRCAEIKLITGIEESILTGREELSNIPVAVRMSWASQRSTTREEDVAYSLLGIFDINMPMLYGEGAKAFRRLQEEIIKTTPDMSIFAWRAVPDSGQEYTGILAQSPKDFAESTRLGPTVAASFLDAELEISNMGIRFNLPCGFDQSIKYAILPTLHYDIPHHASRSNWDTSQAKVSHGIYLHMIGNREFVRALPKYFGTYPLEALHHKHHVYHIPQSISAGNSDACGRRELHFVPEDNLRREFGLYEVQREACWVPIIGVLRANTRDFFFATFNFKPKWAEGGQNFTIICRFRNPRGGILSAGFWECDLLPGEVKAGTDPARDYIAGYTYAMSSSETTPTPIIKVFDLAPVNEGLGAQQVSLTLEKGHNAITGGTRFSLSLGRVENVGQAGKVE
jgi:hypothetical protein